VEKATAMTDSHDTKGGAMAPSVILAALVLVATLISCSEPVIECAIGCKNPPIDAGQDDGGSD
jgi:hypothetical protein